VSELDSNYRKVFTDDDSRCVILYDQYGDPIASSDNPLIVESKAYDEPSDADRVIPVWSPPDLWIPEEFTGSASGNGTTTYYIVLAPSSRWSLGYVPVPTGGGDVITLTVGVSNQDTGDATTATYIDVTNQFFGTAGFTAAAHVEPECPTSVLFLRFQVTVTGYVAGTPTWALYFMKRSNS